MIVISAAYMFTLTQNVRIWKIISPALKSIHDVLQFSPKFHENQEQ